MYEDDTEAARRGQAMNVFLDGASHYSVAFLGEKYDSLTTSQCSWDVVAEGRVDGCIKRTSTGGGDSAGYLGVGPLFTQQGVWSAQPDLYWGLALKLNQVASVKGGIFLNGVNELGNSLITLHNGSYALCAIGMNQNGTMSAYRGGMPSQGAPFLLGTSIAAIDDDEWAYLEVGVHLSTGTDGWIIVRSNGTQVLSFTGRTCPNGLDTFPFPAPPVSWNSVRILGLASITSPFLILRACDQYLFDGQASADPANPNNTFIGDVSIGVIVEDGIGDQTNWVPTGAANNWQCVNEIPPDDGTTYVSATIVGQRDTYAFENVIGDPIAIQVLSRAKKTSALGASLGVITRQGGVDYDGPTQGIGSTSYDYYRQPYDTNPATNLQWTEAEMNAGQWGPNKVV